MVIKPDRSQEQASKEATDWLILLQEDPDDPDLKRRFETWRCEKPGNAAAWATTMRVSSLVETTRPTTADRWRPIVAQGRQTGTRRRGLRIAAVAVAAGLALLFVPDVLLQIRSDHVTGAAQTRTVRLDDGSSVVLAPNSAIAVAYTATERRVDLLAGEAFFEVAANTGRPFRVGAREIRATVVGTMFDMSRNGDGATIAVEHGAVRVDYPAVSPPVTERLEPGQSVRVSWTGAVARRSGPPSQVAAWRRRQLIAQDQPMRDVIDQLRRYYRGTIIVTDRALGDRPVTGVYNLTDPVDALRAIAHAHGATVRQITPWVLVVSRPQT